ncbi:hypothetical protein IE077_002861 [Cardiosporidium cionae]|uniref:Poly(A) RNA polymerase mitochondrial-like central palm domain-containing protein n=1 Tax=Cardiosporidium cionae TaxID=476202 RepID=A0ABQ7J9P1_9APIC|nr:hypothetical protein IE077_002861 [Cardiosporidium cionae]|eukprot:KAF8820731.1 hypothetical protein IE077_002861 [Cardiosporidium cionae]
MSDERASLPDYCEASNAIHISKASETKGWPPLSPFASPILLGHESSWKDATENVKHTSPVCTTDTATAYHEAVETPSLPSFRAPGAVDTEGAACLVSSRGIETSFPPPSTVETSFPLPSTVETSFPPPSTVETSFPLPSTVETSFPLNSPRFSTVALPSPLLPSSPLRTSLPPTHIATVASSARDTLYEGEGDAPSKGKAEIDVAPCPVTPPSSSIPLVSPPQASPLEAIRSLEQSLWCIFKRSEKQLEAILHAITPTPEDRRKKKMIFNCLVHFVKSAFGDHIALLLTGSTAYDADARFSDLDIVVQTTIRDALVVLQGISKTLQEVQAEMKYDHQNDWALKDVKHLLVDSARVPILTLKSRDGILCDVSVNTGNSIRHTEYFKQILHHKPSLRPVMRLVKHWVKVRNLPTMKDGGLPSIVWMSLAVHFCYLETLNEDKILHTDRPLQRFIMHATSRQNPSSSPLSPSTSSCNLLPPSILSSTSLFFSLVQFFSNLRSRETLSQTVSVHPDGGCSKKSMKETAMHILSPSCHGGVWDDLLSVVDPHNASFPSPSLNGASEFTASTLLSMDHIDLAAKISSGTWLVYLYELRRADCLLQNAFISLSHTLPVDTLSSLQDKKVCLYREGKEISPSSSPFSSLSSPSFPPLSEEMGGAAFSLAISNIYEEVKGDRYLIPASVTPFFEVSSKKEKKGGEDEGQNGAEDVWCVILLEGRLHIVHLLTICADSETWWSKEFLSRRDIRSVMHGQVYALVSKEEASQVYNEFLPITPKEEKPCLSSRMEEEDPSSSSSSSFLFEEEPFSEPSKPSQLESQKSQDPTVLKGMFPGILIPVVSGGILPASTPSSLPPPLLFNPCNFVCRLEVERWNAVAPDGQLYVPLDYCTPSEGNQWQIYTLSKEELCRFRELETIAKTAPYWRSQTMPSRGGDTLPSSHLGGGLPPTPGLVPPVSSASLQPVVPLCRYCKKEGFLSVTASVLTHRERVDPTFALYSRIQQAMHRQPLSRMAPLEKFLDGDSGDLPPLSSSPLTPPKCEVTSQRGPPYKPPPPSQAGEGEGGNHPMQLSPPTQGAPQHRSLSLSSLQPSYAVQKQRGSGLSHSPCFSTHSQNEMISLCAVSTPQGEVPIARGYRSSPPSPSHASSTPCMDSVDETKEVSRDASTVQPSLCSNETAFLPLFSKRRSIDPSSLPYFQPDVSRKSDALLPLLPSVIASPSVTPVHREHEGEKPPSELEALPSTPPFTLPLAISPTGRGTSGGNISTSSSIHLRTELEGRPWKGPASRPSSGSLQTLPSTSALSSGLASPPLILSPYSNGFTASSFSPSLSIHMDEGKYERMQHMPPLASSLHSVGGGGPFPQSSPMYMHYLPSPLSPAYPMPTSIPFLFTPSMPFHFTSHPFPLSTPTAMTPPSTLAPLHFPYVSHPSDFRGRTGEVYAEGRGAPSSFFHRKGSDSSFREGRGPPSRSSYSPYLSTMQDPRSGESFPIPHSMWENSTRWRRNDPSCGDVCLLNHTSQAVTPPQTGGQVVPFLLHPSLPVNYPLPPSRVPSLHNPSPRSLSSLYSSSLPSPPMFPSLEEHPLRSPVVSERASLSKMKDASSPRFYTEHSVSTFSDDSSRLLFPLDDSLTSPLSLSPSISSLAVSLSTLPTAPTETLPGDTPAIPLIGDSPLPLISSVSPFLYPLPVPPQNKQGIEPSSTRDEKNTSTPRGVSSLDLAPSLHACADASTAPGDICKPHSTSLHTPVYTGETVPPLEETLRSACEEEEAPFVSLLSPPHPPSCSNPPNPSTAAKASPIAERVLRMDISSSTMVNSPRNPILAHSAIATSGLTSSLPRRSLSSPLNELSSSEAAAPPSPTCASASFESMPPEDVCGTHPPLSYSLKEDVFPSSELPMLLQHTSYSSCSSPLMDASKFMEAPPLPLQEDSSPDTGKSQTPGPPHFPLFSETESSEKTKRHNIPLKSRPEILLYRPGALRKKKQYPLDVLTEMEVPSLLISQPEISERKKGTRMYTSGPAFFEESSCQSKAMSLSSHSDHEKHSPLLSRNLSEDTYSKGGCRERPTYLCTETEVSLPDEDTGNALECVSLPSTLEIDIPVSTSCRRNIFKDISDKLETFERKTLHKPMPAAVNEETKPLPTSLYRTPKFQGEVNFHKRMYNEIVHRVNVHLCSNTNLPRKGTSIGRETQRMGVSRRRQTICVGMETRHNLSTPVVDPRPTRSANIPPIAMSNRNKKKKPLSTLAFSKEPFQEAWKRVGV